MGCVAAAGTALDTDATAVLAKLWELMAEGRSLPTKYKPTLDGTPLLRFNRQK
jgi:hypothetical protein